MAQTPRFPIPVGPAPGIGGGEPIRKPIHESPWHPRWIIAAPHRLGFFAAAVMMAITALWWSLALWLPTLGLTLTWTTSPAAAHALVMSQGFMPLFMVGFLFTAGPRWLGMPEVDAKSLLVPVAAMLAGWALTITGFHTHRWITSSGLMGVAWGWSALVLHFWSLVRTSRAGDKLHAQLVSVSCSVGALVLWGAALAVAIQCTDCLRSLTLIGIWCFSASTFAVVSHRMLPFFTASALPLVEAWHPLWLLWTLLGLLWLQAPLAALEIWVWPWPPVVRWLQVALELPAAVLLIWLAVRWGLVQSMRIRLLAMLHVALVWLGISFALSALSHALMALTNSEISLGLAPTHALTMGYLGGTMLAMTTRVASGHSGRPLAADNPVWVLYWLLHAATLGRVAAALWPAAATVLVLGTSLVWATVCVGWALRYGNWFGRVRRDGKPG